VRSRELKPSNTPAEAVAPATEGEVQEQETKGAWEEGEQRPFWIALKQDAQNGRKIQVSVVAGFVSLDLNTPGGSRKRVLLTEEMLTSLKNNPDLDIRPAAAIQTATGVGRQLVRRQIQPKAKQAAHVAEPAPAAPVADSNPPQVEPPEGVNPQPSESAAQPKVEE
jgi:hypothetical protein